MDLTKFKMSKKGILSIGNIPSIVMVLAMSGLILAFVLQVLGEVKADMSAGSDEANTTQDTITGLGKIGNKFGLFGTIVAIGVIIGLLFGSFPTFSKK